MLVPSDDSNIDSERLASTHRIDGVCSALSAAIPSLAVVADSGVIFIVGDSRN
jgi:hypothetical protein